MANADPLEVIVGYLLRQHVERHGSTDWVVAGLRSYARVRGADAEAVEGLARRLIGDLREMWADAADGSLDYAGHE